MRIAVTGASGLVGRELIGALRTRGDEVVALVRRPRPELGVATVIWQAERDPFPAEQVGPCEAMVHLAGESISSLPWTAKTRRGIVDSRVNSTRAIAEAVSSGRWRPQVFVQASAIGFYGDGGDVILGEESSRGRGFLSEVCEAWEAESLPLASHGVRRVVLRFGLVVSAGGGFLGRVLPLARSGVLAPVGSGEQWMSWIHAGDLERLLMAALDDSGYVGLGNAVAPSPLRQKDFMRTLTRLLHRPLLPAVPAFVLKTVLGEASTLFLFSQRVVARHLPRDFAFQAPNLEDALARELGVAGKA